MNGTCPRMNRKVRGLFSFSMDLDVPIWNIARKFRWNRFGKLIRTRDGIAVPPG